MNTEVFFYSALGVSGAFLLLALFLPVRKRQHQSPKNSDAIDDMTDVIRGKVEQVQRQAIFDANRKIESLITQWATDAVESDPNSPKKRSTRSRVKSSS